MFHNVQLFQVIVVYYLQYIVHVKNLSDQDEQYLVKTFFILCAYELSIFINNNSPPEITR
jgi:hypothetical protein